MFREFLESNDYFKESRIQFTNPLSKSFNAINADITCFYSSDDRNSELPIIESLISNTSLHINRADSPDLKDRISLGGASSMGELQWENDMIGDSNEQNGNDLEWDDYEEENIALHIETDQLIFEIEEMSKSSSNQLT